MYLVALVVFLGKHRLRSSLQLRTYVDMSDQIVNFVSHQHTCNVCRTYQNQEEPHTKTWAFPCASS